MDEEEKRHIEKLNNEINEDYKNIHPQERVLISLQEQIKNLDILTKTHCIILKEQLNLKDKDFNKALKQANKELQETEDFIEKLLGGV